jgi:hypothetical protein
MSLNDPELAQAAITIYNDAASEQQVESGQRLFTLAHLPVRELRCLHATSPRPAKEIYGQKL